MATNMTYMEILNRVVQETKVALDPLTSVNFSSPPRTRLYEQFKDWINTSYTELSEERPEWFFRKERAIISIYPRLYLTDLADTLAVGDVLETQTSGIEFTIVELHTHEEADQNLESETTVSISFDVDAFSLSNLLMDEVIDRTSPTSDVAIAHMGGVGRYDFSESVGGLEDIDHKTVRVHRLPIDAEEIGATFNSNAFPVIPREWQYWPTDYDLYPWAGQLPTYITQTPMGSYALYPQPQEQLLLSFDYTREITEMVDYDDVPEALPAKFHMYLVWKTVEEFADFDNNTKLFQRANKHVEKYSRWLHRDELPQIKWAPSKFNREPYG